MKKLKVLLIALIIILGCSFTNRVNAEESTRTINASVSRPNGEQYKYIPKWRIYRS